MGASADLTADLAQWAEATERARVFIAGLDQADSARECTDLRYTPLRTLLEQAEKASARVRAHLADPLIEPCIPPYPPHFMRDGGI